MRRATKGQTERGSGPSPQRRTRAARGREAGLKPRRRDWNWRELRIF